jgi:hypothetical protein
LGGVVPLPAAVCTVPAGQAPPVVHRDWLGPDVVVPGSQASHCRSSLADGVLRTRVPVGQVVQVVQLD